MATKTTTPEYDFDNWNEEAEEAAIAKIVPEVKYIIVERKFVGRFADGDIVEVPLSITLADIDEMQQIATSPVDQFKEILRSVGGDDAVKKFTSHDLAEAAVLAEKYFRTLTRVQMAALPES